MIIRELGPNIPAPFWVRAEIAATMLSQMCGDAKMACVRAINPEEVPDLDPSKEGRDMVLAAVSARMDELSHRRETMM